jgi:CheY-like chemotaxis protein
MRIVAGISDLMSSTRVRDTAAALGHECAVVRDVSALGDAAAGADLVIVDLDATTGDGPSAVSAVASRDIPVIAYGGHVHADRLAGARAAGAVMVLTRGDFVRRLPDLLGAVPTAPRTED